MITKNSYKQIIIIVVLFLIISKFYNFSMWSHIPYVANIRYLILFLLPVWAYYVHIREKKVGLVCEKYILYFIFVSIFTTIIRIIVSGGGLIGHDLELNIFMLSIYSTYYLFHHYEFREKDIMVALSIIGIIAFIIQVYQNINPDNALFGITPEEYRSEYGEDKIALIRNGLYRFVLIIPAFYVFLVSYYLSKITYKFKYMYFLFLVCFIVLVYMMVTRQYFIATFAVIGYTFSINMKFRKSVFSKIVLFAGIILLILYNEELFSELFDTHSEDNQYTVNARLECIPFMLSQAFSNPILLLTGRGFPHVLWEWGEKYGYYYNDIGVIGQIIPFGIIWVVISFRLSYWVIVVNKNSLPVYIRAYAFGMLIIFSSMAPYGNTHVATFIWVCLLYICDLYLTSEKKYLTENN